MRGIFIPGTDTVERLLVIDEDGLSLLDEQGKPLTFASPVKASEAAVGMTTKTMRLHTVKVVVFADTEED